MRILLITPFLYPDSEIGGTRWTKFIRNDTIHEYIVIKTHSKKQGPVFKNIEGSENIVETIFLPTTFETFLYPKIAKLISIFFYSLPRRVLKGKKVELARLSRKINRALFQPDINYLLAKAAYGQLIKENHDILRTADIIVGSHPHSGSLYLASKLAEYFKLEWVADMRDPWSHDHQAYCEAGMQVIAVERSILDKASVILAINKSIKLETSRRPIIVPNNYTPLKCEKGDKTQNSINLLYSGSVQLGCFTEAFQQGLAQAPEKTKNQVTVRYCGRNFSAFLPSFVGRSITFNNLGFLNKAELHEEMCAADLFILFGWKGSGAKCVMTGKLFDYLQYGKPILCFAQEDTELYDFMKKSNVGPVFSSAEDYKRFLEEMTSSPSFLKDLKTKFQPDENYLRQFQTDYCLEVIHEVLEN